MKLKRNLVFIRIRGEFINKYNKWRETLKKHIIIAGVPRSGKSTISQKISNNLGYQHISMDSIIAGIESVFPETGIHSDADTDLLENIQYISSKMALFLSLIHI